MSTTIYTVYKITNSINNKIYIGVHQTSNPNDSYFGSGIAIKDAIQKYGKSNFTKEILFEYDNAIDMFDTERKIVTESFIKSRNNYNLCIGGSGTMKGTKFTDEHKKNISKSLIGKKLSKYHIQSLKDNHTHSMRGFKHTDETREKMSNSRIGIQFTDEHLKNMSLCQIGEKSSRFSGYYITPWGKFNSGKSASTNLVSIPTLSGWCKNSSRIISNKSLSASKYLQSLPESPLGKTYNDIGFSFLPV